MCADDATTAASVKLGDTVYPKSASPVAAAARIAGALPSSLVLKGDKAVTLYTVGDAAKTKEQAVKVVATQDGVICFTTESGASSFVTAAQTKGESVAAASAHVAIRFMDGDNEVEERELNYGDAFGVLPDMADRDDADFEAWVDDFDGDDLAVSANWIARSDIAIKAKWAHVNKVTFVSRGTTMETRRIHDGEAIGELPAIEEVTGCTVKGWFDAEGTDASEADANLVPTQDMTLYAKWTKNPVKPADDKPGENKPGTGSATGDTKKNDKASVSASKKAVKKAKADLPRTGDMAPALPLIIAAGGIVAIVAARFIAMQNGSVR